MQPLTRSRPRPRFFGTSGPSFALDFVNGTNALDPRVTFTRASSATYFDSAGVLQSAANDVPRFDYNPSTLAAQGLLIEEARTNSIRNSTGVGAVAGTPGTLPTNWATSLAGLTQEVVGAGTEAGINYIDVRFSGTATGTQFNVFWETTTGASTLDGITYTSSIYWKIAAGSLANTTSSGLILNGYDSGGVFLSGAFTTGAYVGSATPSTTLQRVSRSYTGNNASLAFGRPGIFFTTTIGAAIDITLRIGLPQLEQGAFATSVIPTTTTALTRAADVASVNTLSPWFNAAEGTLFVQAQDMSDAAHATSQPRAVSINDNTGNNTIDVSRLPASAQGRARVDTAGVNQFNVLNTAWPLATQAKVALAYKENDFAACLGGGSVSTDTLGTIPIVTRMAIGNITTNNSWVGWIQRITYYPRKLSSAELQAITA